jgi:tRNA(Arg) A34 adenosine deaminase TadA
MSNRKCLDLAIQEAEKSFEMGNYPVGAVLSFDSKIIASSGNLGETTKNYINHAEAKIMIENATALLQGSKNGGMITLYSTLEPCLMCLGIAVMNKVNRIIYIQKDPHSGACNIDRKSLGARYQEVWPKIIKVSYSNKPKELIIKFLQKQIENGIKVDWSKKFLRLLKRE